MFFGKKHKVLVVDDDENMLLLLERTLSKASYKVFKAKNGRESIDLAKKVCPDIIIMDIMMPELDGIGAVLKLKSTEETRSIPIIMCTAVKDDEDEILARNLDVADYFRKASNLKDLLEKIQRVLSK